jgi:Cdc6-like AAA superfamily ATPase
LCGGTAGQNDRKLINGEMTMSFSLGKLTFGHDDAERDAKQGFLGKVFLKTALYNRIKTDQCELVIGRKGAGKSATCLILKSAFESEGVRVALLTPESLSQQKIQSLKVDSINREELYLQTWKYVLLVKVAFELISLINTTQISGLYGLSDDVKAIRSFLKKQGEAENDFGSNLSGLFRIFSKISVSFAGFGGTLEASQAKSENDLMDALVRFESRLKKILQYLRKTEIVVLIDKVDEVWNDTEESKFMISGLLRATHILNESLPMTKIMVFLRSDIFDTLKFHDIDKLNSLAERLTWSESDLKQLIENRLRISANLNFNRNSQEIWSQIFDSKVRSQDSFKYIISRTLRRPRETIQFCNRALRIAQDAQHQTITEDDILSAEIQYSVEKLRDLSSEFLVQYAYLDGLYGLFQGFKLSFTKNEFEARYQEAKDRLERLYPKLQFLNTDGILQTLYGIGFLGAEIDSAYIFFYNMPNLTLPQQEKCVVHPAFHAALGIQERVVALNDFQNVYIGAQLNQVNIGGSINVGNVSQYAYFVDSQNSEQKRILMQASEEIQNLLKQFEQANPSATEFDKVVYLNDETTPSFKRRVVGALQASGETAIDEFILENKYLKVAKAAVKDWLQP